MDGILWKYQKAMGIKKWVKNNAKVTRASAQSQHALLTLVDKDKKTQLKLHCDCRIEAMPAQYKNRDHTFELVCGEDKLHLLAAESQAALHQWLVKLHDVAGKRKDHLFDREQGVGCASGDTGGGGGRFDPVGQDMDTELQDNLLYDSCENKMFPVTIKENAFTDSLNLHGNYQLQLDTIKLSLIEPSTAQILYSWPYRFLRRYGREKTSFSMEVGRRCTSGEGLIRFNVMDGNQVFFAIQQYVSAMSSRNTAPSSVSTSTPPSPSPSPHPAQQAPPIFPSVQHDIKHMKVKVLPPTAPRDRTHSAGSRNLPKPAHRQQYANRGAQSVDDITSNASAQSDPGSEFYSAVSDEAVDRSQLPLPGSNRPAQHADFEPEQHYDVATEPTPKQWPHMQRREQPEGKSNGVKPKPNPRGRPSHKAKEAVQESLSSLSLEDVGDPGAYSSLEQPPGSLAAGTPGDDSQIYSETDDHDHIYDHLARQRVGNSVSAPRLPPPNSKQKANKPAAKPATKPATKPSKGLAPKLSPPEDCDKLYDHLNRGQKAGSQHGGGGGGSAAVGPEDAYDTLSIEALQSAAAAGQQEDAGGYLATSHPPSTVPEESEYAEASNQYFGIEDNLYEMP